jgi:hypothetical protein
MTFTGYKLAELILRIGTYALLASLAAFPGIGEPAVSISLEAQQTLVKKYCAGCHSDSLKSGGLSFNSVDLAHPDRTAENAENVIRKLRAGMMPPPGSPRPPRAILESFAASVENAVDLAAVKDPDPGRPALHRLNRTEYENSVRDLLDLNVNAEDLLPTDDMSHGFDNMADVLTISPTLMEAYIRAAGKVARLAVGDPKTAPIVGPITWGKATRNCVT